MPNLVVVCITSSITYLLRLRLELGSELPSSTALLKCLNRVASLAQLYITNAPARLSTPPPKSFVSDRSNFTCQTEGVY